MAFIIDMAALAAFIIGLSAVSALVAWAAIAIGE